MKLKLEISAVLEHIYHYLTASLASSINLRTPGLGFTCAKMYEYLTIQIPISQYRIPHSSWLDYFFVSLSLPILHDQNKENVMTSYSKWNDNWKGLYWLNIKIWHSRMHKFDLPSQNSWQGIRSNSHEHGFASSLVH